MKKTATYRWTLERLCVAFLSLIAVAFQTSSANASCGDYLVHGSMTHESTNDKWLATQTSVTATVTVPYSVLRSRSNDPQAPKTACEGGRCQSQPIPPPVDHTRISIPRQSAVVSFIESLNESALNDRWPHPLSGQMGELPVQAVPSPPPKASSSGA